MTGIQWLKLDKTNLTEIPEEMGKLLKLVNDFYLRINLDNKNKSMMCLNPLLFSFVLTNIIS